MAMHVQKKLPTLKPSPYHIRPGDHRHQHLHLKKILSVQLLHQLESFQQEQTPQAMVLPLLGLWRVVQ